MRERRENPRRDRRAHRPRPARRGSCSAACWRGARGWRWCPGVFAGDMGPLQRAVLRGRRRRLRRRCSWRWRRASSGSSACRRSRPPASRSSRCSGRPPCSRPAGWSRPAARAAVLTVGTIVAIAASQGRRHLAGPEDRLPGGRHAGAAAARPADRRGVACWAIAGTVLLLGSAYPSDRADVPAPQATLMKTIIEGVLAGAAALGPRAARARGSRSARCCAASRVSRSRSASTCRSPPCRRSTSAAACARSSSVAVRPRPRRGGDRGVLAASGLVAGEGLAGVLVAALVATGAVGKSLAPRLPGLAGELAASALALLVLLFLFRGGRAGRS